MTVAAAGVGGNDDGKDAAGGVRVDAGARRVRILPRGPRLHQNPEVRTSRGGCTSKTGGNSGRESWVHSVTRPTPGSPDVAQWL